MLEQSEQLLSVGEAARLIAMSPDSVRRWARSGDLPSVRVGPSGRYRIRIEDLRKFVSSGR